MIDRVGKLRGQVICICDYCGKETLRKNSDVRDAKFHFCHPDHRKSWHNEQYKDGRIVVRSDGHKIRDMYFDRGKLKDIIKSYELEFKDAETIIEISIKFTDNGYKQAADAK